jgi:hypothetical protein
MSNLQESTADSTGNGNIVPFTPTHKLRRRRIAALAIVVALASLAAASTMRTDSAKRDGGQAPQASERASTSAEFVYFPAQYATQQAGGEDAKQQKDPEEHAQNF